MSRLRLGIDIGSVSVSAAIVDDNFNIVESIYIRHRGNPIDCAISQIADLNDKHPGLSLWSLTGGGASQLARSLGTPYINEFSAISAAVGRLLPDARTIFEMGGQQAKYIHLSPAAEGIAATLDDFAASGLCAAGTGSFLDQQAARLGIDIEGEFGRLAVESENPPHIAGRCSVFAKSDMIHHQQRGVPVGDIIAGLCYAVARNFKGSIVKTKRIETPVAFLGGVGSNPGVIRAFKEVFQLEDDEFIVPAWHNLGGAVGGAILAGDFKIDTARLREIGAKTKTLFISNMPRTSSLKFQYPSSKYYEKTNAEEKPRKDLKCGYLGIDIGSLSTNLVLLSPDNEIISRRYLMTAGRPIEVMQRGLEEIRGEIAEDFEVLGVATTGSGRYLIGELVGADIIRNEITAQATGGTMFVPEADTIFEIGGQDSKFISLENGAVVDFEMNRACAAGTGSFLEEQAERLGIDIKTDFAKLSFAAQSPVACGERCTVFMESDLMRFEQGGAEKNEIVAGLAFAVVHNYLNKVVGRKRIGSKILFQGGVAWNRAVVAAFETVLGKETIVPPHHDVTGAIGAALLAKRSGVQKTNFKGFEIARRKIHQETFLCQDCANMCNITRINDNGRELYYGSRCEKYDAERGTTDIRPNPVAIRNKLFLSSPPETNFPRGLKIGFPRALAGWEYLYLWRRFFAQLGCRIVISRNSTGGIIKEGAESVGAETCFPVKVAHGHLLDLSRRELDFIFLPSLITGSDKPPEGAMNYYCPYIQAFPFMVTSTLHNRLGNAKLVAPIIRFNEGIAAVAKSLYGELKRYGFGRGEIKKALDSALESFEEYKKDLIEKGREFLKQVSPENPAILLVGRHYNSLDPGVSMNLAQKLTDLGALVMPIDMVELPDDDFAFLYWQSGRRILRAARLAKETPGLFPIYVSNFSCGPDSFIIHHFKRVMGAKPHMILELDEHSADAGIITRCEAFLDSLPKRDRRYSEAVVPAGGNGFKRKLLIPRMADHAETFAAAFRACGLDAEVLAETDSRSLELGRKLTGGRECYPALLTSGDLARELEKPGVDPDRIAFFMPTSGGPCRFGQYHHLHKQLLENLGYGDIPVYSPNSDDSYAEFPETNGNFRRLAWRGFLAVDYIQKFLLKTRPREKETGAANKIYHHYLGEMIRDLENGGKLLPEIVRDAFFSFKEITNHDSDYLPVVGVVGEIYIRNNRFSNNHLVEKLESLGVEVDLANFTEWIHYTTDMYKQDSLRKRALRDLLDACLQDYFQKKDERLILKHIHRSLNGEIESPISEQLENAMPYLPLSVGGEAMPAIGKAIDMYKNGCSGIVNTMPFTCMPGNIINAISSRISEDHEGFPWLNIAYEGDSGENDLVMLGAFVESVRAWGSARDRAKN
jgi:predicted CoA-substrate-specific enzyme activase